MAMTAEEYVPPRQESLLSVIANSADLKTYVIDKDLMQLLPERVRMRI